MYIWPSVVFKKHLAGKSRTYRFAFCTVVMVVIINTVCIVLGLPYLLFSWLICLLFYGLFVFSLIRGKKISVITKKRFKNLFGGTYGSKSMLSDIFAFLGRKIKKTWEQFLNFMNGHWFEYITLFLLVLFGLIYFSYGSLSVYSFGCSDMYVHTQWIYNLTIGNIFSSGIYPEGMHFFVYMENALFGVPMYSGVLFTGCINIIATLISLYIFFRELFIWKHSPKLALLIFLIINVYSANEIYGISRMQWSLPMEFGYPAMLLCAAYLIRYLRYSVVVKKEKAVKKAERKTVHIPFLKKPISFSVPLCFKDENLFIFSFAIAVTIIVHFYATILAFFMCVGIAVVLIRQIVSKKFLPLLVGIFSGLMIAIVPFVACFICGIRLQGSLYWALSLFYTPSTTEENTEELPNDGEQKEEQIKEDINEKEDKRAQNRIDVSTQPYIPGVVFDTPLITNTQITSQKMIAASIGIVERFKNFFSVLENSGYKLMHSSTRGAIYFWFILLSLLIGVSASIGRLIYNKKNDLVEVRDNSYIKYIILAVISIVCHIFCCTYQLGLPTIMEPDRICALALMVTIPALVVPVDILMDFLRKTLSETIMNTITVSLMAVIYFGLIITDNFHGFLMYQVSRYNSTVMVTKQIVNTLPKDTFTIVSTTDDYYQIIGKGFHEELIQFINESEVVSYTIPTHYIFLFVEKNPLVRYQDHYFVGPGWLAKSGKYTGGYSSKFSEGNEFLKDTIREDMGNLYFGKFPASVSVYDTLWQRVLLNSKVFVWCQKFNAMYPNEMHVYYEDEDFICYYLNQNPRNLYELATMDPSVMVPPEDYSKPIWPENYKDKMLKEDTEEDEDQENPSD
jgi:hypothetical protein